MARLVGRDPWTSETEGALPRSSTRLADWMDSAYVRVRSFFPYLAPYLPVGNTCCCPPPATGFTATPTVGGRCPCLAGTDLPCAGPALWPQGAK
jgi:hypothetical protein